MPAELLTRIQVTVGQGDQLSQSTTRTGQLVLDPGTHEASVDGRRLTLTSKEYAILELLVQHKGTVLTKEAFLRRLYGEADEPEMKIIDVFVARLRKKLAQSGASNVIDTSWGHGYVIRDAVLAVTGASRHTTPPENALPDHDVADDAERLELSSVVSSFRLMAEQTIQRFDGLLEEAQSKNDDIRGLNSVMQSKLDELDGRSQAW